jgi:hypothetical protein
MRRLLILRTGPSEPNKGLGVDIGRVRPLNVVACGFVFPENMGFEHRAKRDLPR